mgnify:CR=1 FL=1
MIRKIIITTLILITNILSIAETNQQIIDRGNKNQKDIFDKYYKNTFDKNQKNNEVLKSTYSDLLYGQLEINKKINENEMKRLKGKRKTEFKKMYENYNLYISVNSETIRLLLNNFLQEKDNLHSYMFVNTYNLFETFELNMNTILEGEKDNKTVEGNVNTIIDYFYFSGDKKSKEEYIKMSNEEMRSIVKNEFEELNRELDNRITIGTEKEKKEGNKLKSDLIKLEKAYENYDRSFESYVNSSSLSISDKDSIKKLIKYEKIANLRFFKQSLELIKEGEDDGKQ